MVGLKNIHGYFSQCCREQGSEGKVLLSFDEKQYEKRNDGFLNCIQGKVTLLECLAGHQQQCKFQLSKKSYSRRGWEYRVGAEVTLIPWTVLQTAASLQ